MNCENKKKKKIILEIIIDKLQCSVAFTALSYQIQVYAHGSTSFFFFFVRISNAHYQLSVGSRAIRARNEQQSHTPYSIPIWFDSFRNKKKATTTTNSLHCNR